MKKILFVLLTISAGVSSNVFAAGQNTTGLSYSYVEGVYSSYDTGNSKASLNGYGVNASVGLGNNLYARAGYESLDSKPSLNHFSGGLGVAYTVAPKIDLFADANIVHASSSSETVSGIKIDGVSDTGFGTNLGVRTMLIPNLELTGTYSYENLFDGDSNSLGFDARYYITPTVSLGAGYKNNFDTDADLWRAAVRVGF